MLWAVVFFLVAGAPLVLSATIFLVATLPRIGARRKAWRMNTPETLPEDVIEMAARRAVQARVVEAILDLQLANATSADLAPELREQVHATLDKLLDRVASMDVAAC